ncbi:hypothetical protein J4219_02335 [Candidatus Woesearchaeota archaeon]|nr:hypothetical protein [Candidatus Woesearchaeota archaeon]
MKYAFVFATLALLLLAACGQKPMEKAPAQPPAQPDPATSAPSADVASDLDQSVAEVDSLTSELDTSSLDSLDAELAAIDSLDLG